MGEFEEFAEALLDQIGVEINEEKNIAALSIKINEEPEFYVKFDELEDATRRLFPQMKQKAEEFFGIPLPNLTLEFPNLEEFKMLKGQKVFSTSEAALFVKELFSAVSKEDAAKIAELMKQDTAKFFVYSTYAKMYISKISTTYGDYLGNVIYLNKFILSSYPKIILYKQGTPYESNFENVNSGYQGALKMTILEEIIHSLQENLSKINKEAATKVNSINEELAKIILDLDNDTATKLAEYLQLPLVPDEFQIAKRATIFFFLNPDHFLVEQLGPDIMTYNKIEIDPKISELIPQILDIYQRWLVPIQKHHAVFSSMEGMAEFAVQNILKDDKDFQNYLTTFVGTDFSSYQVRKSIGKDFTSFIFEKLGKDSFRKIIEEPPNTKELKNPSLYLDRIN